MSNSADAPVQVLHDLRRHGDACEFNDPRNGCHRWFEAVEDVAALRAAGHLPYPIHAECGDPMRPTTVEDTGDDPSDAESFPWCCDYCGVLVAV